MPAARWRLIANFCTLLIVGGVVWAWLPYTSCVFEVAGGMTRDLNPLTEQHLQTLIEKATANLETVPPSFGDRASLAQPVCRTANPHSSGVPGYILAMFGLIAFLFSRNQVRLKTVNVDAEIARERKLSRATGTKPGRTPIVTPAPLDVGVDVGLSEKDKRLLESVGEVNHRDESLMMYLQRKSDGSPETAPLVPPEIEGYFCPPGYADKSILWVDPESELATDDLAGEDPVNNKDRPFKSLEAALQLAARLVHDEEHKGVMVRLMPGIYRVSIDIPDKCAVVNHLLPAEGSFRGRLKWLTDQSAEDPSSVTLLAPSEAKYAVRFEERGTNQGLFGCHIVGRETIKQAGVIAVGCRSLSIANCTVENFIGGGIRLQDAGTELAGGHVLIHGCLLQRNEAKIGGAVYALRSSLTLVDCIIERNKAVTGGAIYVIDPRAPLTLSDCRIAHNRAQLETAPETVDISGTDPALWADAEGLGGGIYLLNGRFKATGTEFVENGASIAGGGIALLGCRAILDEGERNRPRFARNKSRIGAGLVLIGWYQKDATLKGTNVNVEKNTATITGGGFVAIGKATLQCIRGNFTENEASEDIGTGGALSAHLGAELQLGEVEIVDNRSGGSGGAVAAVDGHLTIKEGTRIRGNMARVSGGGIYAITTASAIAATLAKGRDLKVPLTVTLENIKISNNASTDLGGGLRAGNESARATLPLAVQIGDDVTFQLNRTKSQIEHGDDVWVVWGKQVKATDRDRASKVILR